jgi:hypothetical protein
MTSPAEVLVVAVPALCRSKRCAGKAVPAVDASDPTWPLCAPCLEAKLGVERRHGKKEPRR